MAVNLLDAFREAIGDQTAVKISSYLGESTEHTRSAIGTALPAFLGAVLEKGQSHDGAASVLDFIQHEEMDGSILDKLEDILGGGKNTTQLIEKGSGFLDFLVPDKKTADSIIELVTNRAGIGRGSADTLSKILIPLLMGIIGHQVKTKNLDSHGLNVLLLDQKKPLEEAAPTGLFDQLGFTVFGEKPKVTQEQPKEEVEEAEEVKESGGPSLMSRIVPWIILISIALGLLYIMKSCGGRPDSESLAKQMEEDLATPSDTIPENTDTISPAKPMVPGSDQPGINRSVQNSLARIKLSDQNEFIVVEDGFVDQFFRFIHEGGQDPYIRFTFDSLRFYANTSNITLTSARQLQQISDILQAFPSVNIQIEAYVDSEGGMEINKELAGQRADAVKKALHEMGVASERMSSVGQGGPEREETKEGEIPPASDRINIFITRK